MVFPKKTQKKHTTIDITQDNIILMITNIFLFLDWSSSVKVIRLMNIIVIVTDNFPISPKAFKNVCKVHIVFVEMKKATL